MHGLVVPWWAWVGLVVAATQILLGGAAALLALHRRVPAGWRRWLLALSLVAWWAFWLLALAFFAVIVWAGGGFARG